MSIRDTGFLVMGIAITILFSCAMLYFEQGPVRVLELHERTAIKAHRQQTNSTIFVIGEKPLHNKAWDSTRINSDLYIKHLNTQELNEKTKDNIMIALGEKSEEDKFRKGAYATIKRDVLLEAIYLEETLSFQNNFSLDKTDRTLCFEAKADHSKKFNLELERYFIVQIPSLNYTFIGYVKGGHKAYLISVDDYEEINMPKHKEIRGDHLLPALQKVAMKQLEEEIIKYNKKQPEKK